MSSVLFNKEPLHLLKHFDGVIHEVELGLVIGMAGKDVTPGNAMKHIGAYFLANDFTNRGMVGQFKQDGAPWCLAKSSDGFCGVSDFLETS